MTTSHSPPRDIWLQAHQIAKVLKERQWSPGKTVVKFAIAMDDKMVTMEMDLDKVRSLDIRTLAMLIADQMKGEVRTIQ